MCSDDRLVPVRAAKAANQAECEPDWDLAVCLSDKAGLDTCGRMGWRRQTGIWEEPVGCHAWGAFHESGGPEGIRRIHNPTTRGVNVT